MRFPVRSFRPTVSRKRASRMGPGDAQEDDRRLHLLQSGTVSQNINVEISYLVIRRMCAKGQPPCIQHLRSRWSKPDKLSTGEDANWLLLDGHKQIGNDRSDERHQDTCDHNAYGFKELLRLVSDAIYLFWIVPSQPPWIIDKIRDDHFQRYWNCFHKLWVLGDGIFIRTISE